MPGGGGKALKWLTKSVPLDVRPVKRPAAPVELAPGRLPWLFCAVAGDRPLC
jgi:hypothetical protein